MRVRFALCLLPLLAACSDDPPAAPQGVTLGTGRARVRLRTDRFGMQVSDRGGAVLLDTLDAVPALAGDAARALGPIGATHRTVTLRPAEVPIDEGWDRATIVDDPWLHGATITRTRVEGNTATVDVRDPARQDVPLRVTITVGDDEVRVEARVSPDAVGPVDAGARALDRFGQSFVLLADEHFFGLGERYGSVDHRGAKLENWVEEAGFAVNEDTPPGPANPFPNGVGMTHIPVPFVLSSRGYGLWVETSARSGFDLGATSPTAWRIYMDEPVLRYRILVHTDPKETLAHFTRLTGRARAPAPWVFAPRRRVDHLSRVAGMPEAEALRRRGVPTTGIDDAVHFLPDATQTGRDAEIRAWNADMHAWGYKSIGYFAPYVSAERPAVSALLAYGRANGLFVRRTDGTEHNTTIGSNGWQRVATIDMTNPAAVTWWGTLLQTSLDAGYDGWMLDFGEYIPYDARMHDGTTGWEAHNAYPVAVQRATWDYLQRVRRDDFLFFVRAGYTGTQAVTPMVWSGDPSSSFEEARGLPSTVRAGINAGLSGIPFWGSDISGYTCLGITPADKDLYLRWAAFGALSPDMHDQNACEGGDASMKWTLWSDAETTEVYGRYARLHTRLVPYLHTAAKEAEATGLPIMRHPVLTHPRDPAAWAVRHEYWFGPALYVAPVVQRGERQRRHWLPPGTWVDWWTLARVEGGRSVTRDVPLDVIPLYQRAGTLVPLLDPRVETLAPDARADVTSAGEVADVMDVRAVVRAADPRAAATLSDATRFEATAAAGAPALPAGYAAATEAELAACARCGRLDAIAGGGVRVRLTTELAMNATVTAGGLTLTHAAPRAMRVRWDVVVP